MGPPAEETIREICSIVRGPISAECVSLDTPEFIAAGRHSTLALAAFTMASTVSVVRSAFVISIASPRPASLRPHFRPQEGR